MTEIKKGRPPGTSSEPAKTSKERQLAYRNRRAFFKESIKDDLARIRTLTINNMQADNPAFLEILDCLASIREDLERLT